MLGERLLEVAWCIWLAEISKTMTARGDEVVRELELCSLVQNDKDTIPAAGAWLKAREI